MEKSLNELLQSIVTVTQRDYFAESLDILINSLYTHKTIYELTSLTLSLPLSDTVARMYRELGLIDNDKDKCKEVLLVIRNALAAVETIEMRVAYSMSEADVKDIKNWFYYQLKRNVFLNIIVDPTLIGGIVVYRNGIYRDYSISSYIDQYGRV